MAKPSGTLLLMWLTLLVCAAPTLAAGTSPPADQPPREQLFFKSGQKLPGWHRGFTENGITWELPDGSQIHVPIDAVDRLEIPRIVPDLEIEPIEVPAEEADPDELPDVESLAAGEFSSFREACQVFERVYSGAMETASLWTKRVEVGARVLKGNSDSTFIHLKGQFDKETPNRAFNLETGGQYSEANRAIAANAWFLNANIDFCREGNWLLYVSNRNEYDFFENLNYRGTLTAGVGYRFYNEKDKRLIVRVGPGVTYETFRDPQTSRTTPDMFSELEIRWPVLERSQFESKTAIHPSISELEVFRLVSNNGLLFRLDKEDRWSLKFALRYEHNSRPNKNRLKDDYTSSVLLVYQRK